MIEAGVTLKVRVRTARHVCDDFKSVLRCRFVLNCYIDITLYRNTPRRGSQACCRGRNTVCPERHTDKDEESLRVGLRRGALRATQRNLGMSDRLSGTIAHASADRCGIRRRDLRACDVWVEYEKDEQRKAYTNGRF